MSCSFNQNDTILSLENVGKAYRFFARPQDRLWQAVWRGRRKLYQEFWALREVGFEVRRGEAVGIIGRNGSGKSTLLQLIAGTVTPTVGEVRVSGRVSALLELGSGFNPDFTGRENVFMSGAILGLEPDEIRRRFDRIVSFAEIDEFIDRPVKTYSSGMFARLAFAVAIHVDPEILLVDEILSVGDAPFAFKCINQMKRLMARGVTVLFVGHDVQTVRSLCDRAIWLHAGRVRLDGSAEEVTSRYMQEVMTGASAPPAPDEEAEPSRSSPPSTSAAGPPGLSLSDRSGVVRWGSGQIRIEEAYVATPDGHATQVVEVGQRLCIRLRARTVTSVATEGLSFAFALRNRRGLDVVGAASYDEGRRFSSPEAGDVLEITFEFDNALAPDDYSLIVAAEDRTEAAPHYYDFVENACIVKSVCRKKVFWLTAPPITHRVEQVSAAGDARS